MVDAVKPNHQNEDPRCRTCVIAWLAAVLIFWSGCGLDSDYKQVNFVPKMATARPEAENTGRKTLQVAVAAMVSPKETLVYYRELLDYLGARTDHDIVLVQRRTYTEINQMLAKGLIDIAFTCTGPFITGSKTHGFKAIAAPVVRGQPFYQSYLIVHMDSPITSFADLRGKSFAFTDPESNTGALVPRYWLMQIGRTPESFFSTFTYTYSHDNSILAVAKKLVDGAAVDSHIWEFYQHRNDFYSSKTRVIQKSEPFGSPPLVASGGLDPLIRQKLIDLVMTMHEDPQGRVILSGLMIDRFTEPKAEWYASVERMLNMMDRDKLIDNVAQ